MGPFGWQPIASPPELFKGPTRMIEEMYKCP